MIRPPTLYTQAVMCVCNAKKTDSHHIGYLDKNKTKLQVKGTLTREAPVDYFTFTFRRGDSFRIALNNDEGVRIQLLDGSGSRLLADSGGTNTSLQEKFEALKAEKLELKNGNYLLKVTYDAGISKTKELSYNFLLASGETFSTLYKTQAYADTIYNEILNGTYGETNVSIADVLKGGGKGKSLNIIDYLV